MNDRERLEESRAARRFGFASLAFWASVGVLLETAHAVAWMDFVQQDGTRRRWAPDEHVILCVSGRGDKDRDRR